MLAWWIQRNHQRASWRQHAILVPDLVVWTEKDLFIQRVLPDTEFWNRVLPKGNTFIQEGSTPRTVREMVYMFECSTTTHNITSTRQWWGWYLVLLQAVFWRKLANWLWQNWLWNPVVSDVMCGTYNRAWGRIDLPFMHTMKLISKVVQFLHLFVMIPVDYDRNLF